ncbi:ABC transporter permease [Candidatus Entotheonella palauensis]|uniref:ABC transporter permease n=1 Tax=Candidatus Entotheonella palauensis TaxID=93172 RepID=UPI000B7DD2CA|nr:ABC transporter permease [Candidatus Entotheonella palauensis]
MQRYMLRRFGQAILALFILSILIFVLVRLTGDPTLLLLPEDATEEDIRQLQQALGVDKPWPTQYWIFVSNAVQGDFGRSIKGQIPVSDIIKERLPHSMRLGLASLLVTVIIALPLGVLSAVYKDSTLDTAAKVIAVMGQSMPMFWVGIVLIQIFAVYLRLLPSGGTGTLAHYILPAFTLGWWLVAGIMRLLRSSLLEVLDTEFVKLARIKGLTNRRVIWKHALRNALIPVVTLGGIYMAILITAAILVETVFAWPGIGRLVYESIVFRDFPVVQAVVLMTAGFVIFTSLVVDILYAYLDPRIRYQ